MKKNRISSYFIIISFVTFLTLFLSIVQKSYFNLKKPQQLVEKNALLKEINPNLDSSIISTIESKEKNTDEAFDFSIIRTNRTPTVTPVVKATTSPKLSPTPIPTLVPTVETLEEIP